MENYGFKSGDSQGKKEGNELPPQKKWMSVCPGGQWCNG